MKALMKGVLISWVCVISEEFVWKDAEEGPCN